jgi:hypothetical protein
MAIDENGAMIRFTKKELEVMDTAFQLVGDQITDVENERAFDRAREKIGQANQLFVLERQLLELRARLTGA